MSLAEYIRGLVRNHPGITVSELAERTPYTGQEIEDSLNVALSGEVSPVGSPARYFLTAQAPEGKFSEHGPAFSVGDVVSLKARPEQVGSIREYRRSGGGGLEYYIFFTQGRQLWHNESELMQFKEPVGAQFMGRRDFVKNFALSKMNEGFSDVVYSYLASRTEIQPYQFRPAARFLENASQRLLIADEVGLGKTIEAGIIFLEMKARIDLKRFLVVCPSRLRDKWCTEFRNRFGEVLTNLDANDFKEKLDEFERDGESVRFSGVISIESLRSKNIKERILEVGIRFDLVVIDEAHHFRNPTTLTRPSGQALSDATDAMILLSATPINLGSEDLYHLLNMLDEGDFPDLASFTEIQEPSKIVNHAMHVLGPEIKQQKECLNYLETLHDSPVGKEIVQHPDYSLVKGHLDSGNLLDRAKVINLRRKLSSLNPLSRIVNRTRKREVGGGAIREAHTLYVKLTSAEHQFYEEYLEYCRLQYGVTNSNLGFVLATKERQAASCLPAVIKSLDEGDDLAYDGNDTELDETEDNDRLHSEPARLALPDTLRARGIEIGTTDSKFETFLESLEKVYQDNPTAHVLVFSTFKKTLSYLQEKLYQQSQWLNDGIYMITGDTAITERPHQIEKFRITEGFSVLLMSEVGAEGLDFQFTDILFNYDLPWNPMRVEQRIGRIDRYGQQSEKVRIYSFVLSDTIEERILERLYKRIGIFEESIGGLEPILGDFISGLTKDIFTSNLSTEEQKIKAEQSLNAIEEQRIARRELDEIEDALMGQDILLSQEGDSRIENGLFLSEEELRILLESGLSERYGHVRLDDQGDGYFVLHSAGMGAMHQDIERFCVRTKVPPEPRGLLNYGLQRDQGMPVVFRGDLVHQPTSVSNYAHLLNFRHPLIRFCSRKYHRECRECHNK